MQQVNNKVTEKPSPFMVEVGGLFSSILTDNLLSLMIKALHIIKGERGITLNLKTIGAKIKQARLRLKKTQQQVADECGISKSLLSKIENGQTSSAVATLSKISQSLNVSLSWVLDDRPETDLVLMPKAIRQTSVGDESMGYSYELLANRSKFSNIEPTIVYVTPKDQNLRQEPYTHSQDEFIYILEGSICLLYDDEENLLHQGDSAYFKGTKPHLFIPVDNRGAKVLTIFVENDI